MHYCTKTTEKKKGIKSANAHLEMFHNKFLYVGIRCFYRLTKFLQTLEEKKSLHVKIQLSAEGFWKLF